MKSKFSMATMFAVAVAAGVCLATSFMPPSMKEAVSADEVFKVTVTPPQFRNQDSYQLFQREQFVVLTAAEGAPVAAKAQVLVTLYRKGKDGKYFICWSRSSPRTAIPTSVYVLVSAERPAIVLAGQYAQVDQVNFPFSIFNLTGVCVTNGILQGSDVGGRDGIASARWSYDGSTVRMETGDRKAVLAVPFVSE